VLKPGDVAFHRAAALALAPDRGIYPVDPVLRINLPGRRRDLPLSPLFDDQELDGRAAGGPVYWEVR
jgi:hypothetical protein